MSDLDRLHTLEELLAWCRVHGGDVVDVVVQDEYTHDVIVRRGDGYLVFDTT